MDKVKERIDYEAYRTDTQVQQQSSSKGRRGSLAVAGGLEYPELELLPLSMIIEAQTPEDVEKEPIEKERESRSVETSVYGNMNLEPGREMNESILSIADPKFYEDCLVDGFEDADADMLEEMLPKIVSTKDKSRTWAGRDWDGYKAERKNRNMELLEKVERERLLKVADDAWGRRK
jgi:hypothetical protein